MFNNELYNYIFKLNGSNINDHIERTSGKYIINQHLNSTDIQKINKSFAVIFEYITGNHAHYHILFEYMVIFFKFKQFLNSHGFNENIEIYFNSGVLSRNTFEKYINHYNLPFKISDYFGEKTEIISDEIFIIKKPIKFNYVDKSFLEFLTKTSDKSALTAEKKIVINRHTGILGRNFSEDFLKEIINLGYEKHEVENYSIQQQIELFNSASHIVCAHGGALSNIIYCRNNTRIIEINPGFNPLCYPRVARDLFDKIGVYLDFITVMPEEYNKYTRPFILQDSSVRYRMDNKIIKNKFGKFEIIPNSPREYFGNKDEKNIECDINSIKHLL